MILRALLLLAIVLLPLPAWAAPAFVQAAHNEASAQATTIVATFSVAVTNGALVVGVAVYDVAGGATLTGCTVGATSVTLHGTTVSLGDGRLRAFHLANVSGSPTTVTCTWNGSGVFSRGIVVHEVSGVATASPLDQSTTNSQAAPGNAANAITSGSVTTTTTNQYIFGATAWNSSDITNAGTNFTGRGSSQGDYSIGTEDRILASAGSVAATFTNDPGSASFGTFILTFKEPAAAGNKAGGLVNTPILKGLTGGGLVP